MTSGRDAVVIALGLRDGRIDSMSLGTRSIIAAMKVVGARIGPGSGNHSA